MFPHGGRTGGIFRGSRLMVALMVLVAVVTVMGVIAPSVMGSPTPVHAMASTSSPHPAAPTPDAYSAPEIYYVSVSPPEFNFGQSTSVYVGAFADDAGLLSYSYAGLPAGCPNINSFSFFCTPTVAGYFNVTASVTDSLSLLTATSQFNILIDPVLNGTFFSVNASVIPNLNYSNAACTSYDSPPFYQNFCSPQAETPTLLPLANGTLGLASELYTNTTNSVCPAATQFTVGQIGFSVSPDNGTHFGPAALLGNDTSCAYIDAIEPSFAVSGSNVYGAFIEENSSLTSDNYGNRSLDALAFVNSSDNGSTFSAVQTLDASGNLARPVLAAVGSTIYLVYENIQNSTTPIGGGVLPISLEFLSSTDGGLIWSTPVTLPGLGAAQDYNAMSPSLAISSTGTVAVAYATDRTCEYVGSSGCAGYDDSIVVVTSLDNGTTWVGPSVVASGAGESTCYTGACLGFFFQSTPQTAVAFDPTGADLYVAYAATYDQGLGANALNWNHTGVYGWVSADGGATWSGGAAVAPSGASAVRSFNPGLGVSSQGVFLTYLQANESSGSFGLANSLSQWIITATAGSTLTWNLPVVIDVQSYAATGGSVNTTRSSFAGYSSSVAFNATGTPWVAFALPQSPTTVTTSSPSYYYVNSTYPTNLAVGSLAIAGAENTLVVNFTASGLPTGTPWTFYINGLSYVLQVPSITFMNIPIGATMLVGAYYIPTGQWTVVSTYFNATTTSFYFNETDEFPFSVWVGFEFNFFPGNMGYWWNNGELYIDLETFYVPGFQYVYADWDWYENFICGPTGCTFGYYNEIDYGSDLSYYYQECSGVLCSPWTSPWYLPLGSTFELYFDDYQYEGLPLGYMTGSGTGSYTGGFSGYCGDFFDGTCYYWYDITSGIITMGSAVQETIWLGDAPSNLDANVTFSATGLPSGSVFHATFNGSELTGTEAAPATAVDVAPGAYSVTDVWATAAQAGWEYFGAPTGPNPFVPPLETSVVLAFTSLVNMSAAPGQVTFQAPAIAAGTTWSLTFNGTTYTSHTPWINVTTRPGTFAYSAGVAVGASGTSGFVPTDPVGNMSVVTGATYTITYTAAYAVLVAASVGGFVSINHGSELSGKTVWEPSGTALPVSATASNGYSFNGWAGSGAGSYNGTATSPTLSVSGPIVETASFLPLPGARFNLTFETVGVPTGQWWTINLDGIGYSSDGPSLNIGGLYSWSSGAQGHYNLTVPTVYANGTSLTRYVPTTYPGVVGANGTLTPPVVLSFLPEDQVSLTLSGEGTVQTTYEDAPSGTSVWAVQGSQVTITASPYPGWTFSGWEGTGASSYTGSNATDGVTVGSPVSEVALFTKVTTPPIPTYSVTFSLTTTLEVGTTWGVTLNGVGYSSTGTTLTVLNVSANTYAMEVNTATAPSGTVQYRSTSTDPVAITVRSDQTISIAYESYYYVAVSASVGGTISPGSGWYDSGTVLYLVATANAADSFGSWAGTGSGSYSGSNATASVIVTGPITEVATFQANTGGTAAASIWTNPATWAGFGGAALVVGIALGVIVARLGTRNATPGTGGPQGNPRATSPPPRGGSP